MSSYPSFFHFPFQVSLTIYVTPPLVQISFSAKEKEKRVLQNNEMQSGMQGSTVNTHVYDHAYRYNRKEKWCYSLQV
jgi:hypothetical protein